MRGYFIPSQSFRPGRKGMGEAEKGEPAGRRPHLSWMVLREFRGSCNAKLRVGR